jgi:hypothetical protein
VIDFGEAAFEFVVLIGLDLISTQISEQVNLECDELIELPLTVHRDPAVGAALVIEVPKIFSSSNAIPKGII